MKAGDKMPITLNRLRDVKKGNFKTDKTNRIEGRHAKAGADWTSYLTKVNVKIGNTPQWPPGNARFD